MASTLARRVGDARAKLMKLLKSSRLLSQPLGSVRAKCSASSVRAKNSLQCYPMTALHGKYGSVRGGVRARGKVEIAHSVGGLGMGALKMLAEQLANVPSPAYS